MKKSNKIWKKSEKNRGMVLTTVGGDYGLVLIQGPVHFHIWKVSLCRMKKSYKIWKKSEKNRGMVGDDV